MEPPDHQGQQHRPETAGNEQASHGERRRGVWPGTIERQQQHHGEQRAQLLRRLAIDAEKAEAEHGEASERNGAIAETAQEAEGQQRRGAEKSEAEQRRNPPSDRPTGIAHAGEKRRQGALHQGRPAEPARERHHHRGRKRRPHPLGGADGAEIERDRQARKIGLRRREEAPQPGDQPRPARDQAAFAMPRST